MKLSNNLEPNEKSTAVALGFFDGVHLGHQAVINSAINCAIDCGLQSVVLTFDECPERFFSNKDKLILTDNSKKAEIIENLGIEKLYMIPFSKVNELTCQEFVVEVIHKVLKAKKVFCGFNYRFGKGGEGDVNTLKSICLKYDIDVIEIAPVMYEGEAISSTRIRKALTDGKLSQANEMLGRKFGINFRVMSGKRLGRRLGFPTLNQPIPDEFVKPLFGVYASAYTYGGKIYPSVTNVGIRPSFQAEPPIFETWVIDQKLPRLYFKKVDIVLLEYIRPEKRFEDLENLKAAIATDAEVSKEIFKKHFQKGM